MPDEIDRAQKIAAAQASGNLFTTATDTLNADINAGSHIADAGGHQEAVKQLQVSQDLMKQVTDAATQAAASHSDTLSSIRHLLEQITRANDTLKAQIANGPLNHQ